jgi:hypothetical protein
LQSKNHPRSHPWRLGLLAVSFLACGGVVEAEPSGSVSASGGNRSLGGSSDPAFGGGVATDSSGSASASRGSSSQSGVTTSTSGSAPPASTPTPANESICMAEQPGAVPVLETCSVSTTACLAPEQGSSGSAWSHTLFAIMQQCQAFCVEFRVATRDGCVTALEFEYDPYPMPGATSQGVIACANQALLGQRWSCVPADCWQVYHWNGPCVLM